MFGNDDHPLTQRELNDTIYRWAMAGWIVAILRDLGIQIKGWVWGWLAVLFAVVPLVWIVALTFLALNGDDGSGGYADNTEWFSTVTVVLIVIWVCALVVGLIAIGIDWYRQIVVNKVRYQQLAVQQQVYEQQVAYQQQQAHYADQQRQARMTGQAVVEGLRQAYGETQRRPPEEPTGPSRPPAGPKPTPPTPPAPMGSNLPTLWVPTYQGPKRRELQRSETSFDGIWMNDYRGVDPDDL